MEKTREQKKWEVLDPIFNEMDKMGMCDVNGNDDNLEAEDVAYLAWTSLSSDEKLHCIMIDYLDNLPIVDTMANRNFDGTFCIPRNIKETPNYPEMIERIGIGEKKIPHTDYLFKQADTLTMNEFLQLEVECR